MIYQQRKSIVPVDPTIVITTRKGVAHAYSLHILYIFRTTPRYSSAKVSEVIRIRKGLGHFGFYTVMMLH